MNQIDKMRGVGIFFLSMTIIIAHAQKETVVGTVPVGAHGTSMGSYINAKSPAIMTAYVPGAVFMSIDSGFSWKSKTVPGLDGGQGLHMAADTKGTLYYFYSASGEKGTEGFLSKSSDAGNKWTEPQSFGVAPETASGFTMGSHPKKDDVMLLWVQKGNTTGGDCITDVYATATSSGGKKWIERLKLNKESGECDGAGMINVAPPMLSKDGKILILWATQQKIMLDRSFDGGKMWINSDLTVADQAGGWQLQIPGVAAGSATYASAIDNTDVRTAGIVYVLFADQRNGITDTDIWLLRTPNFGDNWTYPFRVNKDEPGAHQYSPRIAVDQATGYVYAAYFDRRASKEMATDVYLAYSIDGGGAFNEKKINSTSFTPDGTTPELLSVSAHKGVIQVMWTTMEHGESTIHSATIRHDRLN